MHVHNDINQLPSFTNAAITIGTFDGVHQGHCQIIAQLKAEARRINGESVLITFSPHPRLVIGNSAEPLKLINTQAERIALLETQQIDHLVIVPFTLPFAQQPAADYIEKFLVEKFRPASIIIGYDHRFGHNREGNFEMLRSRQQEFGYYLIEIPAEVLNDVAVSSTKIRKALQMGDMATANNWLGYPYFFSGTIIEGNKLGRKLGYPTANVGRIDADKLLPGNGVYAVRSKLGNDKPWIPGMMNIGLRPTVDGKQLTTEVHLFDFDADIYGRVLQTQVLHYLRPEQKFDGLDALVEQLGKDALAARALLQPA